MDTAQVMSFESRQSGSTQAQHRSLLSSHFPMATGYLPHPAPILTTTQHFATPAGYSYSPYHTPPPTTPMSALKQEYEEHSPQQPSTLNSHRERLLDTPRVMIPPAHHHALSPCSSTESHASSRTVLEAKPPSDSKTVSLNKPSDPTKAIEFNTNIDELMKTIQKQEEEKLAQQMPTPAQSPRVESRSLANSTYCAPGSSGDIVRRKKYMCDAPGCGKAFVQKTHLQIHKRTHTGDKPHVCDWPQCGLRFTQRGNLITHQRRHIEDKPYPCSICGKRFAQKGNVKAHEKTHQGLKPFACRLDGCTKKFSQLGNMKTHQNTFHQKTLLDLTHKFAEWCESGSIPSSHRDLFEYFKEHYKNSNKGIKGRGKGRVVAPRPRQNPGEKKTSSRQRKPATVKQEPHSPSTMQPMYATVTPGTSPILTAGSRSSGVYDVYACDSRTMMAQTMWYSDDQARQVAFSADRLYIDDRYDARY
jgi:hypothetical protein